MNDNQPVKASNFNLKIDYPSADVGETLKKKRYKIADSRLGIKDQLAEIPETREENDNNSSAY